MARYLCWGSMGITGLMLVFFMLDLVTKHPFGGLNRTVDVLGSLACGVLGYLSWDAFRDLR